MCTERIGLYVQNNYTKLFRSFCLKLLTIVFLVLTTLFSRSGNLLQRESGKDNSIWILNYPTIVIYLVSFKLHGKSGSLTVSK